MREKARLALEHLAKQLLRSQFLPVDHDASQAGVLQEIDGFAYEPPLLSTCRAKAEAPLTKALTLLRHAAKRFLSCLLRRPCKVF